MFAASKTAAVSSAANYIEDVFSTYLYTGTSPTNQTITNNIDLSTKGGLVWFKRRDSGSPFTHELVDTVQGAGKFLSTPSTSGWGGAASDIQSFNSNGFTINDNTGLANTAGASMVSWTFRKQPKFFDVVTYTGNGATGRAISHSLGSIPGCIIVKATSTTSNWFTWHIASGITAAKTGFQLNATNAASITTNSTGLMTSTSFDVGEVVDSSTNWPNTNGVTYVAYLFAHNAGGFGLTGTDNVISCGSYTGNASATGPVIDLGYEPQFLIIKRASNAADWVMHDNMRGISETSYAQLRPNLSDAEYTGTPAQLSLTSTGFQIRTSGTNYNASGNTYIYIAIRRGPMKVPTDGTKVFSPNTQTGVNTTTGQTITTNFPVDLEISQGRNVGYGSAVIDRLRGGQNYLLAQSTDAEVNFTSYTPLIGFANNTGITDANYGSTSASYVAWNFRRAPSFFDEVCYTGNDVLRTINHNLGVAPEMMIIKNRDTALDWAVYHTGIGNTKYIFLNSTAASVTASSYWNNTSPTASVFTVNTSNKVNSNPSPYVAYLFATCAGVSKVGSYTGTGATQTISCGFTGGARFVLIKRTDSTGNWFVWDTARGMVSGTDPRLALNSTAAESNANWVYTATGGFQIVTTDASVNASGGTYIYLAIA